MSFVEENGGRLIANELSTGQAALFPKGLIHYQYNMGCKPARLIAALSSEDFGTQTVTTNALKSMPDEGLAASMGISVKELTQIRSGFQANPAQAADCMKRCGLA
jgi:oxalate decarboxylase/phosphoglucose isomerase-like protein (cupin superfamily)